MGTGPVRAVGGRPGLVGGSSGTPFPEPSWLRSEAGRRCPGRRAGGRPFPSVVNAVAEGRA